MAGQGNYPFNTAWASKIRNTLHKKVFSGDTDQALLSVSQNYFYDSPILTKKWIRYWSGTAWVDLDVGYVPLISAQWVGDPTNVRDALDRIASAVYALRGNVAIP